MFDDNRNKRIVLIIIGGVVASVLITVIALQFNSKKDEDSTAPKVDTDSENITTPNKDNGYSGSWGNIGLDEDKKEDNDDLVIPSKVVEGSADSIELDGNCGKLRIADGDSKKDIELKMNGIIFDTVTNKVVSSDSLKKGTDVRVYTYSELNGSKLNGDVAEVVLISPKESMGYTPIDGLLVNGNDREFMVNDIKYQIKGKLYSALSGDEYTDNQMVELSDGDRLIYYGEEKDGKVIIDKGFVYPDFT